MAASPALWQQQPVARPQVSTALLHDGAVLEALELDADQAHSIAHDVLAVACARPDRFEQGRAMVLVGMCVEALGRRDQARDWYREALTAMSARRGSPWYGLAYCFRGRVEADADDIPAAELFLSEAARLLGAFHDTRCLAVQRLCRGHLELARARRSRYASSLDDAELARDAARDIAATVPEALHDATLVRLAKQRLETALEMIEERECTPGLCSASPRSERWGVPPSIAPASEPPMSAAPSSARQSTMPPPSLRTQQLSDDALVISFSGRYVRDPECQLIDLSTRRAPRRILKALADQRERAPGVAVSCQALLEAGWPGERMVAQAGSSRVYTAIATLRRMGLKRYLKRRDGGYLLDPAVLLTRCPDTHVELS